MLIYVASSSVPLAKTTTSPSDKGSRIKVEDTTNYVDNRLGLLQEASVYRQYVGDSTEHVSESIGRFLDDLLVNPLYSKIRYSLPNTHSKANWIGSHHYATSYS